MELPDPIDSEDITEKRQTLTAMKHNKKIQLVRNIRNITKDTTGKTSIHIVADRIVKWRWAISKNMQCSQKNLCETFPWGKYATYEGLYKTKEV